MPQRISDTLCCSLVLIALCFSSSGFAKRDFRGLFGSYKPPKFVENEGKDTDFGVNLLISTILPVTPVVSSSGGNFNLADESLHFATFYNFELEAFLTFSYHYQIFIRSGYQTYETERTHTLPDGDADPDNNDVQFHFYNVSAVPLLLGLRYRMAKGDVVPFLGLAGGVSFVDQKVSYGFSENVTTFSSTAPTWDVSLGCEFFFGARAGLKIEVGAYQTILTARSVDGGTALPTFSLKSNPLGVRYSSGIFILL